MSKTTLLFIASLAFCITASAQNTPFRQAFGNRFQPGQSNSGHGHGHGPDAVHRWNDIAIDATGLDHTPVQPGEHRIFGEQLGPCRAARAMAIVHVAIFDTVNAIVGGYHGYTNFTVPNGSTSPDVAVAQAAHDTLVALYPSQAGTFDELLNEDVSDEHNPVKRANGVLLGKRAAAAILAARIMDGSQVPESSLGVDYFTSNLAGHWRQDPISLIPVALGAHWAGCRPFVLQATNQFRLPPPPAMTSNAYLTAYNEVKRLGGDGVHTPTQRTAEQAFIGTFWAYDGTPSLCAPPRLYNQITVRIADQTRLNTPDLARLLALVNLAMADAAMASWDSKYYWDFWRPITGIRESDVGTGPSGTGDGNPNTVGDPGFMPLGAPASNLTGPNFTPPFPTYPSGHATFGGALFQVIRRFYGTDRLPFVFVSDEFNGTTHASDGTLRPYRPRSFHTLSEAEAENGRSRIYLGIHWNFDSTDGIALGNRVGNYVYDHTLRPVPHH